METLYSLPVILVSAKNKAAAATIISEIIDNVPVDTVKDFGDSIQSSVYIWRIVNKYYTVDVRLHPLTDDEELQVDENIIEAHVIYLEEDECNMATAARRAARVPAPVRLLVTGAGAGAGAGGDALLAWAGGARYELVRLRAPDEGVARARDALHAHTWPGLRRTDGATATDICTVYTDRAAVVDDARSADSDSSDGYDDDERGVERAELFAAALGALPAAAGAARAQGRAEGREARLQRAEQLVAAFCRALGRDLDV